jgi:hypothetical protein
MAVARGEQAANMVQEGGAMSIKAWTLVACLGANLYLLGVMVMFAAVVYPQFSAAQPPAFLPLYQAFNERIGIPVVLWEFLALLLCLPLYAARPAAVPLWTVHALLALGVAYFAITFGWHLPAHRPLAAGDNNSTVLATLRTSQWARTAVQLARAGLLCGLAAASMAQ